MSVYRHLLYEVFDNSNDTHDVAVVWLIEISGRAIWQSLRQFRIEQDIAMSTHVPDFTYCFKIALEDTDFGNSIMLSYIRLNIWLFKIVV